MNAGRRRLTATLLSSRGALSYKIDGAGPCVVFCHALGTSMALWDAQVAALRTKFRTLTYDLRGHGRSSVPADADYSFPAMAEDIVALMDHLEVEAATVVGISVGGEVAQMLAARFPSRVNGLLLVSTACVTGPERARLWAQRIAEAERDGMEATADAAVQRWFTAEFRLRNPRTLERWRHTVARTSLASYMGIARTIQSMDLRPEIRAVKCPTRVLVGDRDAATGSAAGAEIVKNIPGAALKIIPGAGHLWNLEASTRFNTELHAWLGSLPGSG